MIHELNTDRTSGADTLNHTISNFDTNFRHVSFLLSHGVGWIRTDAARTVALLRCDRRVTIMLGFVGPHERLQVHVLFKIGMFALPIGILRDEPCDVQVTKLLHGNLEPPMPRIAVERILLHLSYPLE